MPPHILNLEQVLAPLGAHELVKATPEVYRLCKKILQAVWRK
jgi:predicted membrane GTPase involved in stress response